MQDDERPWERLSLPRRDCEPHRGGLLMFLANVSLVCGILSPVVLVTALIGLPLAVAVLVMAQKDMDHMDAGLVDPAGRERTDSASLCARSAAILCLLSWVPVSLLYVALSFAGIIRE